MAPNYPDILIYNPDTSALCKCSFNYTPQYDGKRKAGGCVCCCSCFGDSYIKPTLDSIVSNIGPLPQASRVLLGNLGFVFWSWHFLVVDHEVIPYPFNVNVTICKVEVITKAPCKLFEDFHEIRVPHKLKRSTYTSDVITVVAIWFMFLHNISWIIFPQSIISALLSFNEHLLGICYISGTILCDETSKMNEAKCRPPGVP